MTANNSSSVYAQRLEYNSGQSAQPETSGCLVLEFGSNENPPAGVDSAVPHYSMNHADSLSLTRFSSTVGYDNPAHLATGSGAPGGFPVNQSQRQVDGHSSTTPRITQLAPFPLQVGAPPFGHHNAPPISEVPFDGPPSHVPYPHNVTRPFQGNPGLLHNSEGLITDDLKYTAICYLHKPGSHVEKLRVRRSRSGAEKVLISLDIPIASESGPPRSEYYAFGTPGNLHSDSHPPSQVPLSYNRASPSRGNPGIVHSGMSGTEDFKDLASRYLNNPSSHVNKLRMKRCQSGVKALVLLELDEAV